tara:strand:- start:90036 stop:90290 length:255 start_codon:yes stop_codon:yes gene_type:complete
LAISPALLVKVSLLLNMANSSSTSTDVSSSPSPSSSHLIDTGYFDSGSRLAKPRIWATRSTSGVSADISTAPSSAGKMSLSSTA